MLRFFSLLFLLSLTVGGFSQDFVQASSTFSHKKPAYLSLTDGTEVEGTVSKIKRYRNMAITEVHLKVNGEVTAYSAADIEYMALMPSGIERVMSAMQIQNNATLWRQDVNLQQRLSLGYVYFENTQVDFKKGTKMTLLQVMNPHFSNGAIVYSNPFNKEGSSTSVAGITVNEKLPNSFFIRLPGDENARYVTKKKYEYTYKELFGKCRSMHRVFKKIKWQDFDEHVFEYNKRCGKTD